MVSSPDEYLSQCLVEKFSSYHAHFATAESCTAGMVASAVGDIPGASAVLVGGVVSYTNAIKCEVLGVDSCSIEAHTEVSCEVACQMADGVRRIFHSDIAVSTTGYAGPGGGTSKHPVGTVFVGVSSKRGSQAFHLELSGSRTEIRQQACRAALELALQELEALYA